MKPFIIPSLIILFIIGSVSFVAISVQSSGSGRQAETETDWPYEMGGMTTPKENSLPEAFSKWKNRVFHWRAIREYKDVLRKNPLDYDNFDESEKFYNILGPELMLDIMEEENLNCHSKAHNLGRLIYINNDRDFSKALWIAGKRCTEAAFHGVLMQIFEDIGLDPTKLSENHVTSDEFAEIALSICDHETVRNGIEIDFGSCIHSVGHAIMFVVGHDIKSGLKLCDVFPDKARQYYCATGVFMEREKMMGREDAKISSRFPCDSFDHPAACYRYKLRDVFPLYDYQGALKLCQSLPHGPERNGCFHGMGFTYYLLTRKDPLVLRAICDSTDKTDQQMCAEGAAGRFTIYFGRDYSRQLCSLQSQPFRQWCEDGVVSHGFGMNKNIDMYYVRD